jgi:hypothetical protein
MGRLTDERLAELTRIAETHARVEYSSKDSVLPMLAEIRERRALDLTDDEQMSVLFAREMLRKATYGTQHARDEVAKSIAVLDKVLARGGGK